MSLQRQIVTNELTPAAIFLVLTIDPGGEDTVRDLIADLSGLERTVRFRVADNNFSVRLGIGSDAWDRLFGDPRPAELHPLPELHGAKHSSVTTPGDLLLHIRGRELGHCFELSWLVMDRIGKVCTVADEVHGFKYFDRRDLLGFVDGTENPEGSAAEDAVTVGDEDAEFAGGSYVVVQKYLHDMAAWKSISVEEQERVIGRTKVENVELDDDVKPDDSHVALNTIEDPDGTERQIVRDNMPFGNFGEDEFGTYFIGYSATPSVTEQMLENMFLGNPVGENYDRILDFSTAVTGTLFYVPTQDFLDDPPGPAAAEATAPAPQAAPAADLPAGSLGIGSLRRSATS